MRIWGGKGHLRPLNMKMKHKEYGWAVEEGWSKVSVEEVRSVLSLSFVEPTNEGDRRNHMNQIPATRHDMAPGIYTFSRPPDYGFRDRDSEWRVAYWRFTVVLGFGESLDGLRGDGCRRRWRNLMRHKLPGRAGREAG